MAKVLGPLFSLNAKGTFAKTLTFQGRAGSTAVFLPKTPRDPQSPSQLNIRDYIQKAVYYWQNLSPAYRAEWGAFVV